MPVLKSVTKAEILHLPSTVGSADVQNEMQVILLYPYGGLGLRDCNNAFAVVILKTQR